MNIHFTQSNVENILKELKITEKEVIISDPASLIKKNISHTKRSKNVNKGDDFIL